MDYGSLAVITNQVKGYWTYTVPSLRAGPEWSRRWLTGGWQASGTLNFHGATALTATAGGSWNQSATTGNTYALTCSGLGLGEGSTLASLSGLPRFCPSGNCGGSLASGVAAHQRAKLQTATSSGLTHTRDLTSRLLHRSGQVRTRLLSAAFDYYGTTKPGQIDGAPGFGTVDFSVIKDFPFTEGVKAEFRGECITCSTAQITRSRR